MRTTLIYILAIVSLHGWVAAQTIETVVGGGRGLGDGQLATSVSLPRPSGVFLDQVGNLYISDGAKIRRVDRFGTITTVAGTGQSGFSGDGGLAVNAKISVAKGITKDSQGNLYIADDFNDLGSLVPRLPPFLQRHPLGLCRVVE